VTAGRFLGVMANGWRSAPKSNPDFSKLTIGTSWCGRPARTVPLRGKPLVPAGRFDCLGRRVRLVREHRHFYPRRDLRRTGACFRRSVATIGSIRCSMTWVALPSESLSAHRDGSSLGVTLAILMHHRNRRDPGNKRGKLPASRRRKYPHQNGCTFGLESRPIRA